MGSIAAILALMGLAISSGFAASAFKTFPDIRFGPYVYNELHLAGSPVGETRILPMGNYRLQFGWIEPITLDGLAPAACTFLETDVHLDLSPYQSDVGMSFSLKPFRIFEFGVTYNRLVFNGSMVGINGPTKDVLPPASRWAANHIISQQPGSAAGADVFTFIGAFHISVSRLAAYLAASRSLWDVDFHGHEYLYEYGSDLLIKKRDRIHTATGELQYDLGNAKWLKPFSVQGIFARDRYWYTTRTRLEKNLVSLGIMGLRYGQNTALNKRGLDFSLGYFTRSPQVEDLAAWRRLYLSLDWRWTVDFFNGHTMK